MHCFAQQAGRSRTESTEQACRRYEGGPIANPARGHRTIEMSAKQVTDNVGDYPGSRADGFKLKVLHAEGSRVWGGAMRALEIYLRSSDRHRIAHDIVLAHPVPGAERSKEFCQRVHDPSAPASPFADRGPTLAGRLPRMVERLPGFKPARLVKNWRR